MGKPADLQRSPAGLLHLILPDREASTGGSWALLAVISAIAHGSVRALIAARLLGPAELGSMGIALLVLALLDAFTTIGVEAALISHPGNAEGDLDAAFTMNFAHGILLSILLIAAAPWVALFFGVPSVERLMIGIALVPLLRGMSNPAASLLVRKLAFRRLFWWGLPEGIVSIAIVIAVATVRRDAWVLVAAVVGAQATATLSSYAMVPRAPRLVLRSAGFARLFEYARWIQRTRLLMFIGLNLDNLLVGKFLGPAALGLYQVAFRISEIPVATVGKAAARVTLPLLATLRNQPARLRREYLRLTMTATMATMVFAFTAVVAGRSFVEAVLGERWLPAVPVLRILAVAMIFRGMLIVASELFYAVDRPHLAFSANAARVGVLAVTIVPLLVYLGTTGAALAVLLSSFFGAAACAFSAAGVLSKASAVQPTQPRVAEPVVNSV